MPKGAAAVVTAVLAAIAVGLLVAPAPAEAGEHSAVRSFEPAQAIGGSQVTVTIRAGGYGRFGRVTETLPDGWTYTGSSLGDAAVSVEGRLVRFLLLDEAMFTYTVTAPTVEGTYTFSGEIEDSSRQREPVGGDSEITVLAEFEDVDPAGVHAADINALAAAGITKGCSTTPPRFCPNQNVTRAEMATLLTRALKLDIPSQPSSFDDVDPTSVHAADIEALAAAGITSGCSTTPPRFCPNQDVTRAEMATFLTRALNLAAPSQPAGFTDLNTAGLHATNIEALAAAGITKGCSTTPLRFCPNRNVTRAEMATFLIRALNQQGPG